MNKNGYTWINPRKFIEADMLMWSFEEDRQGMFGWAIKWHNRDNYNHIQKMIRPGFIASQTPTGYKEVPIEKCLKKRIFLKFWQFVPEDKTEIDIIRNHAIEELNKPWWKKRYDFLGIIGQATGLRWIQSPFAMYCSEREAADLRLIPRLQKIIPKRPTPSELNQIFKTMPDMKLRGYWWEG